MKNKENIKIYTLDGCVYCDELKKKLTINGISYTEFNITDNVKLGDEIEDKYGCYLYPIVEVKNKIILSDTEISDPNIIIFSDINELIYLIKQYK
jgi:glutaredoxin